MSEWMRGQRTFVVKRTRSRFRSSIAPIDPLRRSPIFCVSTLIACAALLVRLPDFRDTWSLLEMNARAENPDEDTRSDASGDDPGVASFQVGWFC